jgi:hypothetical protein
MLWWPGERERFEDWHTSQASRMRNRAALERSMAATDPQPYIDLQENFGALAYYAWQQRQPPEPEFPDSPVVKNHNVW